MTITDRVYGQFKIAEPVLLALLKSTAVLRLKRIDQFGLPSELYHLKGFSRYEHSVGVMLLLRRLGARLEEQIAGLLHDVSHTAFSHVVDWVIGDSTKEDYQDNNHERLVRNSDIPEILKKYGFAITTAIDMHMYSLLEREAPDLCADRVDYTLRELSYLGMDSPVRDCLSGLRVFDGKLIFTGKTTAKCFAFAYAKRQKEHWGGYEAVLRFELFSRALKLALEEGTIVLADFETDDQAVYTKLKQSSTMEIRELLRVLAHPLTERVIKKYLHSTKRKKFRFVDPEYLEGGRLIRLSSVDARYQNILRNERNRSPIESDFRQLAESSD